MSNFKKIFAIIFTVAVVVFGVLVMINERDLFQSLKEVFKTDEIDRGIGIVFNIIIIVHIIIYI